MRVDEHRRYSPDAASDPVPMMSKYDPLRDYLKQQTQSELVLSFEEIEDILGFALSRSSQRARWWEKERGPHDAMPQRNAIRDGGFEATRLPDGTGVRFKRIGLKPKWR